MIKRLYVDNYKCLVNFEAQFDRITLLLGANGTGKSSIVDILLIIRELLAERAKLADKDIFPPNTCTRWQKSSVQTVELEVELEGTPMTYRLEVEHEGERQRPARRARIQLETLSTPNGQLFSFRKGVVQLYRDNFTEGPTFSSDWLGSALARVLPGEDNTQLSLFLDFFHKMLICRLSPKNFLGETNVEAELLSTDGGNFAAWYRHIVQEQPEALSPYFEALKNVLDGFTKLKLEKTGRETRELFVAFSSNEKDFEYSLSELSDGQRALLTLYALIHFTANQGYTILLDEPENYVALKEIQPWLIALFDACGKTLPQAILCSHHPEIINYLGAEHSLFFARERSGATRLRPHESISGEGLTLAELITHGWENEQ